MKWFRWLVAVGALLALVGLALALGWGRWSNPRPIVQPAVDLEAFNKARVARQSILIDSMTATGSWERGPGGLKYRLLEEGTVEQVAVRRGDWVEWNVRVAMADDSVCFERPLAFKWQEMDVPTGFHDLAERTRPGDSVEAWIPAHLAWGLTGYGKLVPPDVVIHLNYRWVAGN